MKAGRDPLASALAELRGADPPGGFADHVLARVKHGPHPRRQTPTMAGRRPWHWLLPATAASLALVLALPSGWRALPPPAGTIAAAPRHPDTAVRVVPVELSLNVRGARRVEVAGDFNDWSPERTPLLATADGRFTTTLRLPAGTYEYMFVVDGEWRSDVQANTHKPDGFGAENAVLRL